jgi:hypothetical protein
LNVKDLLSSLPENNAKESSGKRIPSKNELKLIKKIFTDDEDDSLSYYVSEVKYNSDFDEVCCFCVPHGGDIEKTEELSKSAQQAMIYDHECIFDCDYVQGRVDAYLYAMFIPLCMRV